VKIVCQVVRFFILLDNYTYEEKQGKFERFDFEPGRESCRLNRPAMW